MPPIRLITITVALLVAHVPTACGFNDVTKVSTQDVPIGDAVRKINGAREGLSPAAERTDSGKGTTAAIGRDVV